MKILLADDHELVRDSLAALLRHMGNVEVVTAPSVARVMEALQPDAGFDLILVDYAMPGMNGLDGFTSIRQAAEPVPVALMSGVAPRPVIERALAEGAAGYVPKTMSTKSLCAAIRFMADGEVFAPISLMADVDTIQTSEGPVQLTKREMNVLQSLCRGMANKEIALELGLQEVTIKLHVKSLCRKISARNRTHAAMIAKEAGIG